MTRKPVTLTAEASIQDAINLFNNKAISCIPIEGEGKPVGIISWRDILRAIELAADRHGNNG